ncbi:ATP-binding cassette domain-containing protein, partial [Microbacterium sp.]|uniref:ATP-binding cassette domain-containing protein n=1 Tax=Microbacterium sp. TaxID=51671 RepID=UPI0028AC0E7F
MSAVHVRGLRIAIDGRAVVDGVGLDVAAGECVAIVGESGAGKSLTARALLGMLPDGARMTADELRIDGVDASGLSESSWRSL